MILIIGGAYQGKLEYAKKKFDINEDDIFDCKMNLASEKNSGPSAETGTSDCKAAADVSEPEVLSIDFSKTCIYGIEEFAYACIQKNMEPMDYFKEHESEWQDSILICEDIFCGVVPLGADMREWRQATGRLCKHLALEAASVSRIFCGLEQKLK